MYVLLAVIFAAVIVIFKLASVIFGILYMHYDALHKNKRLSAIWYVCGFLFSFPTLIVYHFRRKNFPGDEIKICPQCGDSFYARFEICPKCLITLPCADSEEKLKQKKLSKSFGVIVIVLYCLIAVLGCIFNSQLFDDLLESEFGFRIAVDGVYYDKHCNAYENEYDVLLYDEKDNAYFYTAIPSETDPLSEDYYYMNEAGERFDELKCFVTEEGFFFYDETDSLYTINTGNMTEDEIDEYYEGYLEEIMMDGYKYYDFPYTDGKGNIYYCAYEASWNEKGELIVAENDVSDPE